MNAASRTLHLLVVEDDPYLAESVCEMVRQEAMNAVGPVSSVEQALQALNTLTIDGALLNIRLHGQAVFPVCDVLRQRGKPFAFVSGSLDEIPHRYRDAPALEKPYAAGDLRRVIRALGAVVQA